jgi:uncharacterized protein (UPF0332 family)
VYGRLERSGGWGGDLGAAEGELAALRVRHDRVAATEAAVCQYNPRMIDIGELYLAKAQASLNGAQSELERRRFDNAANRAYYACFQAAIAGLIWARLRPSGSAVTWEHAFVQARFVGELINRRKRYAADLRDTLSATMRLRHEADYQYDSVTADQAIRTVRRATRFVEEVGSKRGEPA